MKCDFDDSLTLATDLGEEQSFEILDLIYYDESEYVVLWPCDEEDETADVFIFRVEELDDKTDTFIGIDDEEVLSEVFKIFKSHISED